MSRATKRKHVVRELLEQFPEPSEQQQIVKVSEARGANFVGEAVLAGIRGAREPAVRRAEVAQEAGTCFERG